MREYTIQYMIDQDWHRVTAVYDTWDAVLYAATQLLADGKVIRILGRDSNIGDGKWHTLRLSSFDVIMLDVAVWGCPK